MSDLLFMNTAPDGTYEVSHRDEVSGEWFPVAVAGPWAVLGEELIASIEEYLELNGQDTAEWELRDADYGLRACGRYEREGQ